MQDGWLRRIRSTKPYDVAVAAPLMALLAASGAVRIWLAAQLTILNPAAPMDGSIWLAAASQAALGVLAWLQVVLILIRTAPVLRSSSLLPRLIALIASTGTLAIIWLPRADVGPAATLAAVGLILTGATGAVLALLWLGRAFSILPEARVLVTRGPYRLLRHPLYAAELVMIAGAAILFEQPYAALVFCAVLIVMIARMRCEERVLAQAFSAYPDYAARTNRLIPGVY